MADDFISQAAAQAPIVSETGGGIAGLNDLLNVDKIGGAAVKGLKGGLTSVAGKLSSMGANFKSPADAVKMFASMEIPKVDKLNQFAPTLGGLMGDLKEDLDSMIGTGTGPLGVPSVKDFFPAVGGGPAVAGIAGGPITTAASSGGTAVEGSTYFSYQSGTTTGSGSGAVFNITISNGVYDEVEVVEGGSAYCVGDAITIPGAQLGGLTPDNDLEITVSAVGSAPVTPAALSALTSSITNAQNLFQKAGIDLDTPPTINANAIKSFAAGLHKIGTDATSGARELLSNMATDDHFGQAIKASLAEGKNKALMAANGISPLSFTDANPFKGLPSDPTNTSTADAAKLLGG